MRFQSPSRRAAGKAARAGPEEQLPGSRSAHAGGERRLPACCAPPPQPPQRSGLWRCRQDETQRVSPPLRPDVTGLLFSPAAGSFPFDVISTLGLYCTGCIWPKGEKNQPALQSALEQQGLSCDDPLMHSRTYTLVHTHTLTLMHSCTHTLMHSCTHTHSCTHVLTHTCAFTHSCTRTHTHTCALTHALTCSHSCTHTHVLTHSRSHALTLMHSHSTLMDSYTHALTHSCTRTLIHSCTQTFVHSCTHTLIQRFCSVSTLENLLICDNLKKHFRFL